MTWIEDSIKMENEALLQKARDILASPAMKDQYELILDVLRIMLDSRLAKYSSATVKPVEPEPVEPKQTISYSYKLYTLPEEIAAIISQTYIELGDAATLADDEALEMIRDKLVEFKPEIIDQNRQRGIQR